MDSYISELRTSIATMSAKLVEIKDETEEKTKEKKKKKVKEVHTEFEV